jgi:hypothetical protein
MNFVTLKNPFEKITLAAIVAAEIHSPKIMIWVFLRMLSFSMAGLLEAVLMRLLFSRTIPGVQIIESPRQN